MPRIHLINSNPRLPINIMRPDSDVQAELPLSEIPAPPNPMLAGIDVKAYRLGECSVLITREFGKWHLSIAHHARYPTWDEISQARYRLLPDDIWVAMYLPPRSEYVNLHRNCFQIYECDPREEPCPAPPSS